MRTPTLAVLVTGPACTGKSTLSADLAARFGLPLFGKDGFKEPMYEAMCPDGDYEAQLSREQSRLLGQLAMECLEVALAACARSGTPAIFEANFDRQIFSPRLARLRARHPLHIVQVALRCRGDVLLARFVEREHTGRRHPGHGGLRHLESLRPALLRGEDEPIAVDAGDDLVWLDTTDLSAIDAAPLYALIAEQLSRTAGSPYSAGCTGRP